MRAADVRGLLIYCSDHHCSHSIAINVRLSDIEDRFVCRGCGRREAEIRSDFHWDKLGPLTRGFRSGSAKINPPSRVPRLTYVNKFLPTPLVGRGVFAGRRFRYAKPN